MGRTVTLRPNGMPNIGTGYWFKYPGSAAVGSGDWAKLSDNDDATYLYGIMSVVDTIELDMTSYTLLSNERCSEARLIQRISGTSDSFPMNLDSWVRPNGVMGDGGTANYNGVYPRWQQLWNPGYAAEFSQAAIDNLRACFRKLDQTTTPAVSEAYIDLWVRTQPTVAITSPTTDQRLFSAQPTISWSYNSQGDTMNATQLKVFTNAVVTGGGFDANTSSAVYDSGRAAVAGSRQVGVALTPGTTYWAYVRVATDFLGADWWSGWVGVRFIVNTPPTISGVATNPATPITTTNRPAITGTYNDTDGDPSTFIQAKVFSEAQYSAAGFDPLTSASIWDSGTANAVAVANAATFSITPGVSLSPNINYKAYVRANEETSPTRWGAYAASGVFTITVAPGVVYDPPAAPEVQSITTDQTLQRLIVAWQGRDNLLTRNQASGDTGTLGLEPDVNLTAGNLVRDTTTFLQGGAAFKMTPTTLATTMSARSVRTASRGPFPVTPGRTYTGLGSSRSASTGRAAQLLIRWFTAGGSASTTPTTTGSTTTNNSTGFTAHVVSAAAPADAAWAELVTQVVTPSEAHYWDNLSFAPGSSTAWARGGLAYEVGALSDSFDRANSAVAIGTADGANGGTWSALRGTWGISSNKAYQVAAAPMDAVAMLPSGYVADGYVQAEVTLSATANRADAGLIFHALDANNFLMVNISKTAANDYVALWKCVAGSYTQLGIASGLGLVNGSTYTLRVEFFGGQVYVYTKGPTDTANQLRVSYLMLSGELNQFGSYGGHGLRLNAQTTGDDNGSRFDNFKAGNLPTRTLTLQRSLDGGTTWANVRTAVALTPADQQVITYDYEVPAGVTAQYRAVAAASEAGNAVTSPYSATLAQSTALVISTWWLKDAVNPALNMQPIVAPPFDFRRKEAIQTFDPLGRAQSVFVSDGAKGIEGTISIWSKTKADYDKLQAILNNGRALLLQDPLGRSWWVKFGQQNWSLVRAVPAAGETTPIRHLHGVTMPFTEVSAPAVV